MEAAVCCGNALTNEVTGMKQAAFLQVIVDGTACFLFEQTHHVEFTDEEFLSQNINR